MAQSHRSVIRRRLGNAVASLAGVLASIALLAPGAWASPATQPQDNLIYMPYGLIHSIRPAGAVDGYLAEIDSYGIDQFDFAMPKFKRAGAFKLPKHNRVMLELWSSRAQAYDAAHAAGLQLTAVYNAKIGAKGSALNLDDPATRANVIAAVEQTLPDGLAGVQLDFEPYPTSAGFITLLEELDAAFARLGFAGRFSVTAPATISRWSPAYLRRVSELVTQLDPLYYDSEFSSLAGYRTWVEQGLAYYSEHVSPTTRIVPILPSYSANPWHTPAVENITSSTEALSVGLSAGDRVNGAGIWSGWGFLLDEEGAYDGSADRADWLSATLALPLSP